MSLNVFTLLNNVSPIAPAYVLSPHGSSISYNSSSIVLHQSSPLAIFSHSYVLISPWPDPMPLLVNPYNEIQLFVKHPPISSS